MILFLFLFVSVGQCKEEEKDNVWVLQVAPGHDMKILARELGLTYLHPIPSPPLKQMYAFSHASGSGRFDASQVSLAADAHPAVQWHERQVKRQQVKRGEGVFYPTDPLFGAQWHLHPNSPVKLTASECWTRGASSRGQGAVVSIVDDGLQHAHPDLKLGYEARLSHDYNSEDSDPSPGRGDGHGTSAAGVAAGRANNGVCGLGVCPECKVAGVRLIAGPSSDYMEAMGLSHGVDSVSVYSNSWGPPDDGETMEGPGKVTLAALEQNTQQGRGGKGSIYVWAGGNGATAHDDGNYDGYANSRFTVTVGAVAHDGKRAYYSEPCACLMVTAPSSGQRGYGITTIDLIGSDGYSAGDCTNDFGGTSSAAPAAAGAIGLLLGFKPELTRRDVLMLLAKTSSRLVDRANRDWTPLNGRGISHNHEYGWGMIDPAALLNAASAFEAGQTKPELVCSTGKIALGLVIGDGTGEMSFPMELPNVACVRSSTSVPPASSIDYVEYVEVRVWLSHRRRGDLVIRLSDPHGVVSRLATPHADNEPGYKNGAGWTFGSARHWGQTFSGVWTLFLGDMVRNGRTGILDAYEIVVRGHKE